MADLADILDALEGIALTAVFPGGPGTTSVSGTVVNISQGWPPDNAVNDAMPKGWSLVSIWADGSTTSKQAVPLAAGQQDIIIAPVHGMTATATDTGFTLSGAPGVGEYATAIVNGTAYSYAAGQGDTAASVMAALAGLIPGASVAAGSVSIPGAYSLAVRIGAPATMGEIIDRQQQNFRISVWAPSPSDRTVIGAALKLAMARNLKITLPDTSEAVLKAQSEMLIDKYQLELAYRRDLTVQVEWDTVDRYPAYEITSVNTTIDGGIPTTFVQ